MSRSLLLLLLPVTLAAQTPVAGPAPVYACERGVFTPTDLQRCLRLRDLYEDPLGADSLEIRIWHDVALTGLSLSRLYRFAGVWRVQTFSAAHRAREVTQQADFRLDGGDGRYQAAVAAGLLTLPPSPTSEPALPRADGEWFVLERSADGGYWEALSNRPISCEVASDRTMSAVIVALGASPAPCPP